jgi:hypothetical protein
MMGDGWKVGHFCIPWKDHQNSSKFNMESEDWVDMSIIIIINYTYIYNRENDKKM